MVAKAGGSLVFRSPRIGADVGLLIVLLPIAAAALAFLIAVFAVPLLMLLGIEPDDWTLVKWCTMAAIPIVVIAARRKLFWSIALEQGGVRLGKAWPRRVPYDRVRFIKTGRDFDPSRDVTREAAPVTPLSFATGWLREYRLFLRHDEAERALRELHARCPNAAAVDADGVSFAPRNRGVRGVSYAEFRAVRSLAIRGTVAAVASALDLLSLVARDDVGALSGRVQWVMIGLVGVFAGYAVYAARRIRRITDAAAARP